jgi:hypothetical protein
VAVCAADTPAKTNSKAAVSTAHPISRFIVVFILDTTSEYFASTRFSPPVPE